MRFVVLPVSEECKGRNELRDYKRIFVNERRSIRNVLFWLAANQIVGFIVKPIIT